MSDVTQTRTGESVLERLERLAAAAKGRTRISVHSREILDAYIAAASPDVVLALLRAAESSPGGPLAACIPHSAAAIRAGLPDESSTQRTDQAAPEPPGDALRAGVALREAVTEVVREFEALPDTLRAVVERSGVVFDKWPPADIPSGGWTPERLAALDPEVRWQGIAFTMYTDWVVGPLSIVIRELKEAVLRAAGSGEGGLAGKAEERLRAALAVALHECLPDSVDDRMHAPSSDDPDAEEPFCEYLSHALIGRVMEPAWLTMKGLPVVAARLSTPDEPR